VLLIAVLAQSAWAGIAVTSYETVALTNGFAPVSQAEFFARQALANVSPATAEVSGDWIGPNAGGSTPTWHFVGHSQTHSETTVVDNGFRATASGSFSYEITTTADFIDPRSGSVFAPSGAANYEGFFDTDVPTTYAITAQLNQLARVTLNSLSGSFIFNQSNPTATPLTVNLDGTIPPGRYRVLFTTGLGAPNFPNGINHYAASGSYENVTFTVQVPEPCTFAGAILCLIQILCRRRRRCCAC